MAALDAPGCSAMSAALAVLSRQWNGVILHALRDGALRFSELVERGEGIGDKVLSSRLKELEARGLVVRDVDVGPPVRVSYALTDKGRGFQQVAQAIERWGASLLAGDAVRPPAAAQTKQQRAKKKKKKTTTTTAAAQQKTTKRSSTAPRA